MSAALCGTEHMLEERCHCFAKHFVGEILGRFCDNDFQDGCTRRDKMAVASYDVIPLIIELILFSNVENVNLSDV